MIDRLVQAAQVFNEPMTLGMMMLYVFLFMVCRDSIAKPFLAWLRRGRTDGKAQADKRIVTVPIGVLKELNSIGSALATGYPYGVFRLGDKIGDVTISSQEASWGYMMTEEQLYKLQGALQDMRPFLKGNSDAD